MLIFSPIPSVTSVWKGVLSNGKSGLFNPAHTVAYIGNNLPAANKPGEFTRGGNLTQNPLFYFLILTYCDLL